MKVKHDDVAKASSWLFRSESERSSTRKHHLNGLRIDKQYYGQFISLKERKVLGKLFGAAYDDINQILVDINARDNLFTEPKSSTKCFMPHASKKCFSNAFKIIDSGITLESKKIKKSCSCCSYGSKIPLREQDHRLHKHGVCVSSVAPNFPAYKAATERIMVKKESNFILPDLCTCTSKICGLKEKESITQINMLKNKNDMMAFDHPFEMNGQKQTPFRKKYIEDRQAGPTGQGLKESLAKHNKCPPIIAAFTFEPGSKTLLENIKFGINESMKQSFTNLKRPSMIIRRPPYNFMDTPRISFDMIKYSEPKIKKRIEKYATGDTTYKIGTNLKQQSQEIEDVTNPNDRFALRRCFCKLILNPYHYKLDLLSASKTVAKAMRNTTKTSLQSNTVIRRLKVIKRTNKRNVIKARQQTLNTYIPINKPELTQPEFNLTSNFNFGFEFSKVIKPENNLVDDNNPLARTWAKIKTADESKTSQNVYLFENVPIITTRGRVSMNSLAKYSLRRCFCTLRLDKTYKKKWCNSSETLTSGQNTSPVAKLAPDSINKASDIKEWENPDREMISGENNPPYTLISYKTHDLKPEIIGLDKCVSTIQNVNNKNTQIPNKYEKLPYDCKLKKFSNCSPNKCQELHNEIEQNEGRRDYKDLETQHLESLFTVSTLQTRNTHIQTTKVQTNWLSPVNKIPAAASKLQLKNQAVQIDTNFSSDIQFCKEKSPVLRVAKICQCTPVSIDIEFQTVTVDQEAQRACERNSKLTGTDSNYEKNVFERAHLESGVNRGCCSVKQNNVDGNKISTSIKEKILPRKEMATKSTQIKSFYQGPILQRDTLRDDDFDSVTDISKDIPMSHTSVKPNIPKDYDNQTNRNRQRTNKSILSPLENKNIFLRKTMNTCFSRDVAESDISSNIDFSQSRKKKNLYVSNNKTYLINDLSNKLEKNYREDLSRVKKILPEWSAKYKTSSSSFSSIIGTTTTTTTDSSHSFPKDKRYKNNKQSMSTSNEVNSRYYKSSFYQFNIQVKNTHKNETKHVLEPYECEPGACYPAPGECDPIECDKLIKKRLMRNTSRGSSTDYGKRSIPSGPYARTSNRDSGVQRSIPKRPNAMTSSVRQGVNYRTIPRAEKQAVRINSTFNFNIEFSKNTETTHKKIHEKKPYPRHGASTNTQVRRRVSQGTAAHNRRQRHVESQSDADIQHVGINTHAKRCFCTLKLHKMGRVYRDRGVAAKHYRPKPNVLREAGTVTVKEKGLKGEVTQSDLEPYECEPGTCIPGECDPYECLERIKRRGTRTKDKGSHIGTMHIGETTMTPIQKRDESSRRAVRIASNFSFSIEFSKENQNKDDENIKPFSLKPPSSPRTRRETKSIGMDKGYKDNGVQDTRVLRHQDSQVEVQGLLEKGTRTALLQRCFCTKKLHEVNDPSLSEKCKCLLKTVQVFTTRCLCKLKKTDSKSRQNTKEKQKKENLQTGSSSKSVQFNRKYRADHEIMKVKEVSQNTIVRHSLADLDPNECEPGTCIPGECDPYECLERIKRRGMRTKDLGTHMRSKNMTQATMTPSEVKAMKRRTHKDTQANKPVTMPLSTKPLVSETPKQKQAVRVSSTFSFNIEFSKDKTGFEEENLVPLEAPVSRRVRTPRETRSVGMDRKYKESGIQGTGAIRHQDSQVEALAHHEKGTKTGTFLKRCFCTAKLHGVEGPPIATSPSLFQRCLCVLKSVSMSKKGKEETNTSINASQTQGEPKTNITEEHLKKVVCKCKATKALEKPKINLSESQMSQTNKPINRLQHLEPYECEPGVCVPGECDPYVCYERIKRRKNAMNKKLATEGIEFKTTSTFYQSPEMKQDTANNSNVPRKAMMTETERDHDLQQQHTSEDVSPTRSAVRIGSRLTFNIEFSKNLFGMDGDTQRHADTELKTKQGITSSTETSAYPRTQGRAIGDHYPLHSQDSQVDRAKKEDRASGGGFVLRRCFCTLSLQKR